MKFHIFNTPVSFTTKGRKYPIQKDEYRQSLRQRCFELFKQGKKAREVAAILRMKLTTARRYYSQWNRCPPDLELMYKRLKKEFKEQGQLSPRIIDTLCTIFGMPEWQIVDILYKPYGLKSLLMGKLLDMRKQQIYCEQELRLKTSLHLIVFLENIGVPIEWVYQEIKGLIQRAIDYAKSNKGFNQSSIM